MDPGMSFHSGRVISQTQNPCRTSARYWETKNATTTGSGESAERGEDARGEISNTTGFSFVAAKV